MESQGDPVPPVDLADLAGKVESAWRAGVQRRTDAESRARATLLASDALWRWAWPRAR